MSSGDFYPLTWEHYGILIDDLWKDLINGTIIDLC